MICWWFILSTLHHHKWDIYFNSRDLMDWEHTAGPDRWQGSRCLRPPECCRCRHPECSTSHPARWTSRGRPPDWGRSSGRWSGAATNTFLYFYSGPPLPSLLFCLTTMKIFISRIFFQLIQSHEKIKYLYDLGLAYYHIRWHWHVFIVRSRGRFELYVHI